MHSSNPDAFFLIGLGFLIMVVVIAIAVFFLRSQDKAALSIRTSNPATVVHRAWVWTQFIPLWNIVAFIVYHIQMKAAVEAYSKDNLQAKDTLLYPNASGWFYGLAILYAWIPFAVLIYFVGWIIFWVRLADLSKAACRLSSQSHKAYGIN